MKISNKTVKVLSMLLVILMCVITLSTVAFAATETIVNPGDIVPEATDTSNRVQTIAGKILGVVQVIGVAVAVIMLIVLAIKYISAAPNDKAEIKKHAVVYVVGAVVLFAASGILEVIKTLAGTF